MTAAGTPHALRLADADAWCLAAADRAMARLTTEIARMDAIDLAAPWVDGIPSRAELATAFAMRLGRIVDAGTASDGRRLAAALAAAWVQHRARLTAYGLGARQARALRLRTEVDELRMALDIGVAEHDLQAVAS